jgi:cell division GTPase FtsZ
MIVERISESGIKNVKFIVLDSDEASLKKLTIRNKVLFDEKVFTDVDWTKNAFYGKRFFKAELSMLSDLITGSKMAIVVVCLGGKFDSLISPSIVEIAS